jgi:hypothetical protein
MSSCSGHCWCYKGWGAPSSRGPLAAAAVVVLGFAVCRAIGGEEGLAGLKDGARGSAPVLGSGRGQTGEESRDVVAGGGVADGGCGGLLPV